MSNGRAAESFLGDDSNDGFGLRFDLGSAWARAGAGTSLTERQMLINGVGLLTGYRFYSFLVGGFARYSFVEQITTPSQVGGTNLRGTNVDAGIGLEVPLFWSLRLHYLHPLYQKYQLARATSNQETVTYSAPGSSAIIGVSYMMGDLFGWGETFGLSLEAQTRTFTKAALNSNESTLTENLALSGYGVSLTVLY